jgi:RHS repeat-associated protein
MRVIQERSSSNVPTVALTRGSDLSGSLEGAGGIGGLLSRSHGYSGGTFSTHSFYHADGNGNVTYLVSSAEARVAEYRYDPYGNLRYTYDVLPSGGNRYRFSSKEQMPNSGLYSYGYRFYDPNLQRWLNRDPINERGFRRHPRGGRSPRVGEETNQYLFVRNRPVRGIDAFGLRYGPGYTPGMPDGIVCGDPECEKLDILDVGDRAEDFQNKHSRDAGTGRYRHCVSACLLMKCHFPLGPIVRLAWDLYAEDPNHPDPVRRDDSIGDMQAEDWGEVFGAMGLSCEKACMVFP